jgi:hypothetical protein
MSKEMREQMDKFKNLLKEDSNTEDNKQLPEKSGWYWVLIKGYKKPKPCWYMGPDSFYSYEEGDECFLPGGVGDSSSMGIYIDGVEKIGPEIEVPEF